MVDNALNIKLMSQFNAKATTIKVDLSFLVITQPEGGNYVNVQLNSQEWLEIRQKKVTGSCLADLFGFLWQKKLR